MQPFRSRRVPAPRTAPDTPPRRWISVDQLLNAIEDRQAHTRRPRPPRPRPLPSVPAPHPEEGSP